MDYKYIKRVNWPWVEIVDNYGPEEDTVVINVNEITTVWTRKNTKYYAGVRYKNGDWCEALWSTDALKELKNLIMEHDRELN